MPVRGFSLNYLHGSPEESEIGLAVYMPRVDRGVNTRRQYLTDNKCSRRAMVTMKSGIFGKISAGSRIIHFGQYYPGILMSLRNSTALNHHHH